VPLRLFEKRALVSGAFWPSHDCSLMISSNRSGIAPVRRRPPAARTADYAPASKRFDKRAQLSPRGKWKQIWFLQGHPLGAPSLPPSGDKIRFGTLKAHFYCEIFKPFDHISPPIQAASLYTNSATQ
jgi:hypothetical protein